MRKLSIVVLLASSCISGCATTSEMPLAPNVVRLDTQASGLLFTGAAPKITMKKAAEATLARGYTHFRLEQAAMSSGRRLAGITSQTTGNASATTFGNSAYGTYSSSTFTAPIYAQTANIGVTVVMFHANEPGAKGAWDASEVLKKNGAV